MKLVLLLMYTMLFSQVESFLPMPGISCDISRCNHAPSTPAFKECIYNLHQEEDKKLNILYIQAMHMNIKNQLSGLTNIKYKQKLKTIQKYWLLLRDYQCLLESEIFAPDSAKEYFCLCEMTKNRNQDLQRIIQN